MAFAQDKQGSMPLLDRLATGLEQGIAVTERCTLRFAGNSRFVDAISIKMFLADQAGQQFTIEDTLAGTTKTITGIKYADEPHATDKTAQEVLSHAMSYDGPFFLSRGAPASETLEDFPELATEVARALAGLHEAFPQGLVPSSDVAHAALRRAQADLRDAAAVWAPIPMSKEANALGAMLQKPEWAAKPEAAAREGLLRSAEGRRVVVDNTHDVDAAVTNGFVHGDAHGRNFIIVWFEYHASPSSGQMDRLLLNEVFRRESRSEVLFYSQSDRAATISASSVPDSSAVTRKSHVEVHPIDFDDASFTQQVPQLIDAITIALSAEAIAEAFGTESLRAEQVLDAYLYGRNS